ncbi:hypothetical protein NEOLI_000983 [Neolecta irregularis DAH-3]|uniref:Uncharacterized protein n=1 Tax=Neolecta irregularis (strain DAH-3) TaxID=1198029 RepID=A0A1U7LH80_NEOID|nr:hypothetical protein NEOLI_000983 [Neolecta irregularis DAH-3]|eukprot:OLL21881.1 hypothetical protein NEOLI_000983 [Neolecta irregularis DAH-3]
MSIQRATHLLHLAQFRARQAVNHEHLEKVLGHFRVFQRLLSHIDETRRMEQAWFDETMVDIASGTTSTFEDFADDVEEIEIRYSTSPATDMHIELEDDEQMAILPERGPVNKMPELETDDDEVVEDPESDPPTPDSSMWEESPLDKFAREELQREERGIMNILL